MTTEPTIVYEAKRSRFIVQIDRGEGWEDEYSLNDLDVAKREADDLIRLFPNHKARVIDTWPEESCDE